jgi:hypothetical protein
MFSPKAAAMSTITSPASAPLTSTRAQLHRLLDAGLAHSATYRGSLSNHLPMGQQALLELGASAERLQAWTEAHETLLEPQACGRPGPVDPVRDLGRPASDPAWRAHFERRIAALGAGEAVREALPALMPGVGGAAFHGLIRTAHAVLAGHDRELAAGLAHWAALSLPLRAAANAAPLSLPEWLAALATLPQPEGARGGLIFQRMRAWADTPGFADIAPRLPEAPDTLRDIALLAARTYAVTGNFTVLHLLTASHAMHVLSPAWPGGQLPRGFIVAAASALLASGAAPALALDHPPSRPWPTLISAACAQDDAHVIKLTHAAWRLGRAWPDPAWRRAVERAIPL